MNIRLKALPILRAKESALRLEVKRRKKDISELEKRITQAWNPALENRILWSEMNDILAIENVKTKWMNVAGVRIRKYEAIEFKAKDISLFHEPAWVADGRLLLMRILEAEAELAIAKESLSLLVYAGKKTTQKVNLYEKVQIPFYQNSILKIKRFLEDEENLSKASQKIMKKKRAS